MRLNWLSMPLKKPLQLWCAARVFVAGGAAGSSGGTSKISLWPHSNFWYSSKIFFVDHVPFHCPFRRHNVRVAIDFSMENYAIFWIIRLLTNSQILQSWNSSKTSLPTAQWREILFSHVRQCHSYESLDTVSKHFYTHHSTTGYQISMAWLECMILSV